MRAHQTRSAVRDAAVECLEEVYRVVGEPLIDVISHAGLRPAQLREIYARLGQTARAAAVPMSAATSGGGAPADTGAQRDTASSRPEVASMRQVEPSVAAASGPSRAPAPSDGGSCPGSPGSDAQPALQEQAPPQQAPPQRPRSAGPRAPSAAGAAPSGAGRRGGYKDAGGVGVAGELPPAPPLVVASERELRSEMDKIIASFDGDPAANWQKRISAMVRLEGLVKGGAAAFDGVFDDCVRSMRDIMGEQLLDRRSAISRQACHLLAALSAALGSRFDSFAATMLPLLFKVGKAERFALGVRSRCWQCQQATPMMMRVVVGSYATKSEYINSKRVHSVSPGAGDHSAGRRRRRRRVRARAGPQPPHPQDRARRVGRNRGRQERQAAAELQRLPARGADAAASCPGRACACALGLRAAASRPNGAPGGAQHALLGLWGGASSLPPPATLTGTPTSHLPPHRSLRAGSRTSLPPQRTAWRRR